MNEKGFTLVELLAVIAILGILSIIVTPAVMIIRNNVLENSLNSKISFINSAAKEYALETQNLMRVPSYVNDVNESYSCIEHESIKDTCEDNCLKIYVKTLIDQGYLAGDKDDKTILTDPTSNESLNNKLVCIRYDTNDALKRKLVSYVVKDESETE